MTRTEATNLQRAEHFASIAREEAQSGIALDMQRAQIYAALAGAYATIALAKGEKK